MTVTLRALQGDEMINALYALNLYSFRASPPFMDREEWATYLRGREGWTCFATFEDETPVSVVASTALTQNMRGKLYPAAGIRGVSTAPAARRKGYCKRTIAALLAAERASGVIFSDLYPFRESFYEKLGYVSFPINKIARFSPATLAPLLKMDLAGEVVMQPIAEAYEALRAYMMELRQERHGMSVFTQPDWPAAKRNRFWVARAVIDGKTEGVMVYRLAGEDVTRFNFIAPRFYYSTSRARYLLLEWIARHIDQADRAEIGLPAHEQPDTWLSDILITQANADRAAMSRVLDVARIGGMAVGSGAFSARIHDPLCPWNEGTWHFASQDGTLSVTPAPAASAECDLGIQALTALVAGAHDPQDFALRGWGTPTPAIQATLRTMFPRLNPFLHEEF